MMVDMHDRSADPVRPELRAAFTRAWEEIPAPGTWWNGEERVAIAAIARSARVGAPTRPTVLPAAAAEAAAAIATAPGATTAAWVTRTCEAIGELRYVELIGIVARVSALDTFHRLTGRPLAPLPEPHPGEPSQERARVQLRENHTWVAMAVPSPPFVLGAVPEAMAAMIDLSDVLYMPLEEMADPDWHRGGFHHTQSELVAAATSYANECFY